ncbi:MAG: phosphoglycerate kinase [Planctomycetia bacterium]|nr:phosphoglycerate kinase [Planctomycetia bacterium]
MLKTINNFDLKNKRVLIRVDFNVPLSNGLVTDDFRIRMALPTINHCLESGASVVLMSHLGRPKGQIVPELSLIPIGEKLAELIELPIKFSDDCISEDARDVSLGLRSGEIHLLENLRYYNEETDNDPQFSELLAKHGEIFINDAFGTAHRPHASNVGVTRYFLHKGIGFLFEKELKYLSEVINKPKRPMTLILGGSKISTKLKLINKFIDEADAIIIGGGMAFTFLKAKGIDVGGSLVDESMLKTASEIIEKSRRVNKRLHFPIDVIAAKSVNDFKSIKEIKIDKIPNTLSGFDIGPATIEKFSKLLLSSKTIIWNGPMGVFEKPEFDNGTLKIARILTKAKEDGSIVIVGGGDTAAAVKSYNLIDEMSHVSTGGGASLELLSGNRLPSVEALEG